MKPRLGKKFNFPADTTQYVIHQVGITTRMEGWRQVKRMAGDPRTWTLHPSTALRQGNPTPTPSSRLDLWKCSPHKMSSSQRTVLWFSLRLAARQYSTAKWRISEKERWVNNFYQKTVQSGHISLFKWIRKSLSRQVNHEKFGCDLIQGFFLNSWLQYAGVEQNNVSTNLIWCRTAFRVDDGLNDPRNWCSFSLTLHSRDAYSA